MERVWEDAQVVGVRPVADGLLLVRLLAPAIAGPARPGQFVMLGPLDPAALDPFLNRPFSIHRTSPAGELDLLVAQVGRGTRGLAAWAVGRRVGLLGPLGRAFEVPAGSGPVLLVAGGVGLAPLVFLAERLEAAGRTGRLLYGAASARVLLPAADRGPAGWPVEVSTDDGSLGQRGLVTDLLRARLSVLTADQRAHTFVAACGPGPMLRALAGLCAEHGVAAQVSLESRMACGTGACMGCADIIAGRPQRVCAEGPVFDAAEVFG